jgi:hypothetical protein
MHNITEYRGNRNEITGQSEQQFAMLINSDVLLSENKQKELIVPSAISLIISRLIAESKHGEMLSRLQIKLGKTTEEIYELISEL